jgi:hypothetical protein
MKLDRLDGIENLCFSGGAKGADLTWGYVAKQSSNHSVVHWSFKGHKTRASKEEVCVLDDWELDRANAACAKANLTLRRHFPPHSNYVRDTIRRNWFQVARADSVYAVSSIDFDKETVNGGTGWAVQMFLDAHGGDPCDAFVFDQTVSHWFRWNGQWESIYQPPRPTGYWAGIGTRDLKPIGRLAIYVLFDFWPRERTIWSG